MPDMTQLLAAELSQLTPVELDAFCQNFAKEFERLPMGVRRTDTMAAMAEQVLQRESYGDAVTRIQRYVK